MADLQGLAVAMSGGVDSSLAALLLMEQGAAVLGLSLKLGQGPDLAWRKGREAARQLGIPHRVVDVSEAFERLVVSPVVQAYASGLTPNPCALCNARVKLPLLWAAAREAGCAGLATGHYARLTRNGGGVRLAEAADVGKSQAYFLARVRPELLERLCFPLAELEKAQVRQRAAAAGLAAAEAPESQDVCFLPPGGWDELVRSRGAARCGPVEDDRGRELGRHQGLHRFTVGQRRGLGVALGRPAYVLALEGARAAVRIGPEPLLFSRGMTVTRPRWQEGGTGDGPLTVRVRYAHRGVECTVEQGQAQAQAHVSFAEPVRAVAPGQLAVFSRRGVVVGSAWIVAAHGPRQSRPRPVARPAGQTAAAGRA